MGLSLSSCTVWWFRLGFYWLYLDQSCVNFPVADAFESGKSLSLQPRPLFRRCARIYDDRALAAAEKLLGPRDLIDERHAIARHLSPSHPVIDDLMTCPSCGPMIWINFGARGRQGLTRTRFDPRLLGRDGILG